MLDILKEYGLTLLQLVLTALLPILATYIIQLVKVWIENAMMKLGDQQAKAVKLAANLAVQAAEQMQLAGQIEDKKLEAIKIAQAYLDEHGVGIIDVEVISDAIEAAVMEQFNWSKTTGGQFAQIAVAE